MTREHRYYDAQTSDQPHQDAEFSPSTVKTARKRQTENGVVYCLYCGLAIKHPTHERKHHLSSVSEGKTNQIAPEDIRDADNCGIVHAKGCHPHLDAEQKKGRSFLEVMRKEGRMQIVNRYGPESFLQGGEWITPRITPRTRSRGNHGYQMRGRY